MRFFILSFRSMADIRWHFSFSKAAGGALFFSFDGTTLTCSSAAQTLSMVTRGVTDLYLAQVTSPNLLVFTLVSVSFGLGGGRLISLGTLIDFGASG